MPEADVLPRTVPQLLRKALPVASVMSAVDQTDRQPGHPNLLGPRWKEGCPSPNPGGKSSYQRSLEAAIQKQETPERVCAVIAAMHEDAVAHEKFSPAAAKVYLQAVGVELNKVPPPVDLSDVPEEELRVLREKLRQ